MSKITITCAEPTPSAAFLTGLKGILGVAPSELRTALQAGAPVFEAELFLNNHEEVAQQIRAIRTLAEQSGVALNYYELQPGEDFATCPREECEVDAEVLTNIIG